jgi:arylsulfatase A-like enzyme
MPVARIRRPRRQVSLIPLTLLLLCAGCPGPPPGRPAADPSAPNILVILTDDQRTDTMAGMPRAMKWFGLGGRQFTNAVATTPVCCPSRASVLTGLYAHNHGVRGNLAADQLDHEGTVQRHLHDAGYFTAIAGKFLNGWDLTQNPPHFDRWAIFDRGYRGRTFNVDGAETFVEAYTTRYVADRAVEYLRAFEEEDDDRPWFVYLTPYAPHEPWSVESVHVGAPVLPWEPNPAVLESDTSDKPPVVQAARYSRDGVADASTLNSIWAHQLRSLLSVDDLVDRVLRLLVELEEGERTLAVFSSDNGFVLGEHGLAGVGRDTGKRYPYEPSIRVPLFLRWPGHVTPGTTDGRLVANVDIAPTILDAVGLPEASAVSLDGHSLMGDHARREILVEYFQDPAFENLPGWASLWTPKTQYIEWYGSDGVTVFFREYYDLEQDPWQLENLIASDAELDVDDLPARLARYRTCAGTSGPDACP